MVLTPLLFILWFSREPGKNTCDSLVFRGVLRSVIWSKWVTPTAISLTVDGKTLNICGDYLVTLNWKLRRQRFVAKEPRSILSGFSGPCDFSLVDLNEAYLPTALHSDGVRFSKFYENSAEDIPIFPSELHGKCHIRFRKELMWLLWPIFD